MSDVKRDVPFKTATPMQKLTLPYSYRMTPEARRAQGELARWRRDSGYAGAVQCNSSKTGIETDAVLFFAVITTFFEPAPSDLSTMRR